MGSGPSKEEKKPEPGRETNKTKPVANVNNQGAPANNNTLKTEPPHSRSEPQTVQSTFITQQEDPSFEERNNRINANGQEKRPYGDDEDPSSDARGRARTKEDRRVWRADRETEDELNEVLQVPTTHNRQTSRSGHSVSPAMQEDLPETYAHRKQREQYTLNQQMLLRQKTIIRNPNDWRNEEEAEEVKLLQTVGNSSSHQVDFGRCILQETVLKMEEYSQKGGFDPSKFRSVNKSQPVKNTVFSTNRRQDEGVQYVAGRQNMDEFDVTPRHDIPKDVPLYNQSEQDLMASLERELM